MTFICMNDNKNDVTVSVDCYYTFRAKITLVTERILAREWKELEEKGEREEERKQSEKAQKAKFNKNEKKINVMAFVWKFY